MNKEEYLHMYKEDKLAEIYAQLDELSSYWGNVDKLFEKLQTLPAKGFIKLYYKMKELIENNTVDKNSNNWRVAY